LLGPWIAAGGARCDHLWGILGHHEKLIRNDRIWALLRQLLTTSEPPPHMMDRWARQAPERCCEALAIRLLASEPEHLTDYNSARKFRWKEAAEATPAAFVVNLCSPGLQFAETPLCR
jgi:hypothetical protein